MTKELATLRAMAMEKVNLKRKAVATKGEARILRKGVGIII